jgi:hypothetical protein
MPAGSFSRGRPATSTGACLDGGQWVRVQAAVALLTREAMRRLMRKGADRVARVRAGQCLR